MERRFGEVRRNHSHTHFVVDSRLEEDNHLVEDILDHIPLVGIVIDIVVDMEVVGRKAAGSRHVAGYHRSPVQDIRTTYSGDFGDNEDWTRLVRIEEGNKM